jgi:hypothetical protein
MELSDEIKAEIDNLWGTYVKGGYKVQDLKENEYLAKDFDQKRRDAIINIKTIISDYLSGVNDLKTFKSTLDGYNKRNNYWGFAALKGQMFFNQLWNSSSRDIKELNNIINICIQEPQNILDAKSKIDKLENYVYNISVNFADKRKAPKVSAISYFLSYFWQISNPEKYPIIYTSLIQTLEKLGLWKVFSRQSDTYEYFYNTMGEIKKYLEESNKKKLHHWDIEHCFWRDMTNHGIVSPATQGQQTSNDIEKVTTRVIKDEFSLKDYIPPIISDLIEAGCLKGDTKALKGVSFEKKVAAVFKMLDFDVEILGQGKGREPDGILTFRQDNMAFLYDAKVRENGYSIGVDDRAIKEYISRYHSDLERQGYKKLGFLIISSKFNGNPDEIIDELTLETSLKRVALVTSEAILHLLAYKLCNGISTSEIAHFLLQNGILEGDDVDEKFADI